MNSTSDEDEVEMQLCEYCQEYIPVSLKTGDGVQVCHNSLCPFEVYEDKDRETPLDFNDKAENRDEAFDYSGLVADTKDGC